MNKLFCVSCHSTCRSYFASYLQSVTVVAKDKEQAVELVEKWLKKEGRKFIYKKDKWRVDILSDKLEGVVDYHQDSDY